MDFYRSLARGSKNRFIKSVMLLRSPVFDILARGGGKKSKSAVIASCVATKQSKIQIIRVYPWATTPGKLRLFA